MSQSTVIVATLIAGFIVYLAANNRLSAYFSVFGIGSAAPAGGTTTTLQSLATPGLSVPALGSGSPFSSIGGPGGSLLTPGT